MSSISGALQNIHAFDDLARMDSPAHRVHPLAHLLTALTFIIFTASFGRYALFTLLPYAFFPLALLLLSGIPASAVLKRAAVVLPLVMGIGLFGLFLDKTPIPYGNAFVSGGVVSFTALLLKALLTVSAALLMLALTGIEKLCYAMRLIKIPKLFVLLFALTYRYLSVMGEEAAKTTRAYVLRSGGHKGIHIRAWGPLVGQLLLRTFERAREVYHAMLLRGFGGEYRLGAPPELRLTDAVYFILWTAFFAFARFCDIPALLGGLMTGV